MPTDLPTLILDNAALWQQWLARHGPTTPGIWLTLAKKGTTTPTSLTYSEALDEALCQGWIDGQARKGDEQTYCQRFTPRTAKSSWSKRNVGHVARLEREGRMQAAGWAAVESAKKDGRWEAAYAGSRDAEAPEDFLASLAEVPAALETWEKMGKGGRYMIYMRLSSLKTPAGREKRIKAFVEMLAKGDGPVSQKGVKRKAQSEVKARRSVDEPRATGRIRSGRDVPGRY